MPLRAFTPSNNAHETKHARRRANSLFSDERCIRQTLRPLPTRTIGSKQPEYARLPPSEIAARPTKGGPPWEAGNHRRAQRKSPRSKRVFVDADGFPASLSDPFAQEDRKRAERERERAEALRNKSMRVEEPLRHARRSRGGHRLVRRIRKARLTLLPMPVLRRLAPHVEAGAIALPRRRRGERASTENSQPTSP